jgi:hypothetical protein
MNNSIIMSNNNNGINFLSLLKIDFPHLKCNISMLQFYTFYLSFFWFLIEKIKKKNECTQYIHLCGNANNRYCYE